MDRFGKSSDNTVSEFINTKKGAKDYLTKDQIKS